MGCRPLLLPLALVGLLATVAAGCGGEPRADAQTTPAAATAPEPAPATATTAAAAPAPAPAATTAPAAKPPTAKPATPAKPAKAAAPVVHLPRLPLESRWSLPPTIELEARGSAPAGTAARALRDGRRLALAPEVAEALAAGRGADGLAPLLAVPISPLGPVLVLRSRGRTARVQATSVAATRRLLRALVSLPAARRPRLLLAPAPTGGGDVPPPPRPQAGDLATLGPIYLAAGSRFGIDWRVLAAINEVETSLGTNLSTSTAGAVGWMQFMPGTWRSYGIDGSGDGVADPWDPEDAIFSAANYLAASGAATDIRRAVFSYNHAWWYVNKVLRIAAALPETPPRSAR